MIPTHFVDFEASGIAPDSYPIEIAIVSADTKHQALIKPMYYWEHWSYDAQDMHQISRDQLLLEGVDPHALAVELNFKYQGLTICSDSPQDCFWLDTLYEAAGIEPKFEVKPIEWFVGREAAGEIARLMSTRKSHRALQDALDLQEATATYFRSDSRKPGEPLARSE